MYFKEEKDCLGTRLTLEIVNDQIDQFKITEFWSFVVSFEKQFSRFLKDSELSKLNSHVGGWLGVSDEMISLLVEAERLNSETDGYFDVLVESTLSDLGYDSNYSFIDKRINLLKDNDLRRVEFDLEKLMVKIPTTVDLGGLGKGYILDVAKRYFGEMKGCCLNAGGDIWVHGTDETDKLWKIYIENPVNLDQAIGFIESDELFLASSNVKKRRWGKHHHLINPKFLLPADEMLAVYVQSDSGLMADVFSTALFVMGFEKAKLYLINKPHVEAMLVSNGGAIWKSAGYSVQLFES